MRKPTSLQVALAIFVLVLALTAVTLALLFAGYRPGIEN
jgi:hypothetical protein